ncbi:acetyl-CoA carboxylase biotin carboxylase subunit [Variovorax saccharolyticus]|uniref:acetyl-CoA carboxylase biotin carboxylase subunit n=1 Tax=Variovorax saccharolyticus TaxID=3053516 RepID=UPI00257751BC|nr:acetyl-CoA carboxylase biotin carboxylase subunit [Variovorax sp. J22R187]MDM0019137.1 acetyl-CoA carboxylase biotin carboxylase subunit [Variovorax sp. J22R187]
MSRTVSTPVASRDIRRLFVANRGEIAVRVIRACRSLGIEAVVGVSEADTETLAARMADAVVVLGPPLAAESYLRADRIVEAALQSGCDAVHPGYGFLSERSSFVRACVEAGLVFVGPSAEAIDAMGDKITAVGLAQKAGVPRVPGSGALSDVAQAQRIGADIGYPVLIKATAGGGGRGMRIVRDPSELESLMSSAANEAQSAFGDATLYMEKFIEHARHIEIQVMADSHGNVVYLGERECSTQRRHQKLIEEAPSPAVDEAMRRAMGECAVSLTRNAAYCGAGTIEFVVDQRDNRYFFLEMNTRIQVEHPVTEMITGFDLVAEQIRVAAGLPLSFTQDDVKLQGHAIECRINAEDPERNFLPRPGLISRWDLPSGEGIRVDSHCYAGYTVPPYYDSLLGKLIVHAPTRQQAIARMRQALGGLRIEGPSTTAPFHDAVLAHDDFVGGKVTTRWVEETFLPQRKAAQKAAALAARAAQAEAGVQP